MVGAVNAQDYQMVSVRFETSINAYLLINFVDLQMKL